MNFHMGARVADALAAAGGFAADADVNAVNQAEKLWDEAQVHVPSKTEATAARSSGRAFRWTTCGTTG